MLVKWEKLVKRIFDFLDVEKDEYISMQSRRYWILRDQMRKLDGKD